MIYTFRDCIQIRVKSRNCIYNSTPFTIHPPTNKTYDKRVSKKNLQVTSGNIVRYSCHRSSNHTRIKDKK